MFLLLPSFQFYQKFRSDWFQQTGLEATRDPVTPMRSPLRPPPWVAQRSEFLVLCRVICNLVLLSLIFFILCVCVCVLDKLLWVDVTFQTVDQYKYYINERWSENIKRGTTNDNKCVHQGSNKETEQIHPQPRCPKSKTPTCQHQMPTTRTRLIAPSPDRRWMLFFLLCFHEKKGRYQGEVGKSTGCTFEFFFFLECKQPGGFLGSSESNGLLWWRSLRAVFWSKPTLILGKSWLL